MVKSCGVVVVVVVAPGIILSSPGTGNRGTLYFPFPFSHFHFPIPISHSKFPIPIPIPSSQSQAQAQSQAQSQSQSQSLDNITTNGQKIFKRPITKNFSLKQVLVSALLFMQFVSLFCCQPLLFLGWINININITIIS